MFAHFAAPTILTASNAPPRVSAQNAYLRSTQKMGNVTYARISIKIVMSA